METMATKYARSPRDWTTIEILYTKTDESVRRIANLQGVSHTAILKRAAKRRWVKFHLTDEDTSLPLTEDGIPSVPNPREPLPQPELESEPHDGGKALEATKQSDPQDLLEHARSVVTTLLGHLDAAIARKDIRSPARASAVKSLAGAAKQLIDGSVGKPMGKKEQAAANAKELARGSPFAMRRLPPKFLPSLHPPLDENRTPD